MTTPVGFQSGVWSGTSPWRSLKVTNVSVITSPTALPSTALSNRKGLWLFNTSSTKVFIGDADVDSTNEMVLFGSGTLIIPADAGLNIYGRVASGSVTVIVWEFT